MKTRLMTLFCKIKLLLRNPKEVKTGSSLAESSEKDCGSVSAVLLLIRMFGFES
jgi:hypothetical protein